MRTSLPAALPLLAAATFALTACAAPASQTGTTASPAALNHTTSAGIEDTKTGAPPPGAFYLMAGGDTTPQIKVVRNGRVTTVAVLPADSTGCSWNTASVSPDGAHLAWVQGDGHQPANTGALRIADIDGKHARTIANGVLCVGPKALTWDATSQVVARLGRDWFLFDIKSGSRTKVGRTLDLTYSANGRLVAERPSGDVHTVGPVGGQPTTIDYAPPADQAVHWAGWQVHSISSDGTLVSVGWNGTDPSRRDWGFAVVRVADGAPVTLPHSSSNVHVEFLTDSTVFALHDRTYDILDEHLRVLTTVPLPSDLTTFQPLRYVP